MHEVPEFSKLFCFADDAKLVFQKDSCLQSGQHDLCALRLWSYCNSLSFNIQKCGYLHFNRTSTDALFIGKDELSWLEQVSDLGVEVSSSLKWGAHLKIKFVKACRALSFLKHSVPSNLSSGVKFNLYKACVISVLWYGYPAWYPDIYELRKLESLNYLRLRWCFGCDNYEKFLQKSHSLPISYQLIERDLRFFLAVVNEKNCISFDDYFKIEKKIRSLTSAESGTPGPYEIEKTTHRKIFFPCWETSKRRCRSPEYQY